MGHSRLLSYSCLALLLALLLATPARADVISVGGSTSGTFNSTGTNTLYNLKFLGTSFSGTTSQAGNLALANLGTFQLANCQGFLGTCSTNYTPQGFTLSTTFTLPTGVNGSPTSFTATLAGTVGRFFTIPYGNVDVIFSNPTQTFTYSNAAGHGSFVLTLNNVMDIPQNSSRFLTGAISNAVFNPVPEPSSVILMATLMAGVGLLARKQFRKL